VRGDTPSRRRRRVVGRENLPGLGIEGEFVSAWGLARLLTTSRPRRDILRRPILVREG